MSASPTTAEELYELVCVLQRQQQATQLELRAVQQRSGQLRDAVKEHQVRIAEERARRRDLADKLAELRLSTRRLRALEDGAVCAARDALGELGEEQAALLRALHNRATLAAGCTTSTLKCSDSGVSSDITVVQKDETQTDVSRSEGRNHDVPTTPQMSQYAPLYSGAATHAILWPLLAKLANCISAASDENAVHQASRGTEALLVSTEPSLTTLEVSHVNPLVTPEENESAAIPSSKEPCAHDECPTAQPKKHIEFAADASISRVTPVPACNANRTLPTARLTQGDAHTSAPRTRTTPPPAAATPTSTNPAGVARGTAKFTVRVASRSSTLVAEAAALGAKRQRSLSQAGPPQVKQRGGEALVSLRDAAPSVPPSLPARRLYGSCVDAAAADACTAACPALPPGSGGVASAACGAPALPRASNAEYAAAGPRVSVGGGGAAGPRRTVWVWSPDSTQRTSQ